eukprot:gnl/TRDRNA2_/TRDRNA2_71580_c0_seq1.p1 gnl/TRDRNA2_/TRDRNA2_71580_c0~~gnl/TRDRNA2_/TRDRNA2_71580_c0_seq1.p1  ORF type:complete len:264 (-),score=27.89 gnl/TRDRNA2_/TRDRNA2_71580_c0_seq1:43-750(-)
MSTMMHMLTVALVAVNVDAGSHLVFDCASTFPLEGARTPDGKEPCVQSMDTLFGQHSHPSGFFQISICQCKATLEAYKSSCADKGLLAKAENVNRLHAHMNKCENSCVAALESAVSTCNIRQYYGQEVCETASKNETCKDAFCDAKAACEADTKGHPNGWKQWGDTMGGWATAEADEKPLGCNEGNTEETSKGPSCPATAAPTAAEGNTATTSTGSQTLLSGFAMLALFVAFAMQ